MSKLMQLSNLYIRGAMATQTMPGLSQSEVRRINDIVIQIEHDQSIAADKYMFIKQLGATIRGDYKSDELTAIQEFRIAIWRATIYLLHHRNYSYHCLLCGATEYQTGTDKLKAFDRQYKVCPKCQGSLFNSNGETIRVSILKREQGFAIINENNQILLLDLPRQELDEILKSPINPIHGPRKIEDPEKILNDDIQRNKWYVTWIWNYFRQILNENIIKTHNKHLIEICGPADRIAFEILVNELKKIKHKFSYDEGVVLGVDGISNGLSIETMVLATEPSFSLMLGGLKNEFRPYNVDVVIGKLSISIKRIKSIGGVKDVPVISTTIESEDQVVVLSFDRPVNGDGDDNCDSVWSDIIESNNVAPIYDGRIDDLISDEAMGTVRVNLCDSNARKIFDIFSQTGETWTEFSSKFGLQQARKTNIAEYLSVSVKQVDIYKQQIACWCLINGLK